MLNHAAEKCFGPDAVDVDLEDADADAGADPADERRREPRLPQSFQVRVALPGGPTRSFLASDVSSGGLFLRTRDELPRGTQLRVSFVLPRLGLLEASARVAWTTRGAGERMGWGLSFVDLPREVRAKLAGHLGLPPAQGQRAVVLEDDAPLRARLVDALRTEGLSVVARAWRHAAEALALPHELVLVGAGAGHERAALERAREGHRGAPLIVLLDAGTSAAAWGGPEVRYRFSKPVDPVRVGQLAALSLKPAR